MREVWSLVCKAGVMLWFVQRTKKLHKRVCKALFPSSRIDDGRGGRRRMTMIAITMMITTKTVRSSVGRYKTSCSYKT